MLDYKCFSAFRVILFRWLSQTALNTLVILFLFFIWRQLVPESGERATFYGITNEEKIDFGEDQKLSDETLNERRLRKSRQILERVDLGEKFKANNDSTIPLRVLIAIVAAKRPNGELTQVIAHLSAHLNDVKRLHVVICNTEPMDGRSSKFAADRPVETREFARYFDVIDVNIYDNATPPVVFSIDARIAKEATDYWRCLNASAHLYASDYVLMLEDDALPTPLFQAALNSVLTKLDQQRFVDVDYVKMFHPWHLRGIPSIIQGTALSFLLAYLFQLFLWRNATATVSSISAILMTTLVSAILIRVYFRELLTDMHFHASGGSVQLVSTESCCTQAVLFRVSRIGAMLVEFTSQRAFAGHAKDHILDESSFEGRATAGNYVAHVGYYSVLRGKRVRLKRDR